MASEFKQFEDAARGAGVADPFGEAQAVLSANRGAKADAALGKWILDNKVDFPVRGGQVSKVNGFDDLASRWIGTLMTLNKWNRGQMAQREFERKFADLRGVGFEPAQAASVAMDVGEKLVKYHMLDFANRLQVEQDLRWMSYFATKHRLYWKWLTATFTRTPGAAALVDDVRQHLNGQGNLNFSLLGHQLTLPAARLVWVPGKEYSEYSPIPTAATGFAKGLAQKGNLADAAQRVLDSVAGTYGNIFTRQDTTLNLMARLVAVYTGAAPATYGMASIGLPKAAKDDLAVRINSFQRDYIAKHGQPAPEADAVRWALWHSAAVTFWQSGMPLPVLPARPSDPAQQQVAAFEKLTDPAQRRAFLDKHPDVAQVFGIYTNPADYVYSREFWARFNSAHQQLEAARASILDRARTGGAGWTADLEKEYRQASKTFSAAYAQLQLDDATRTGSVVNGQVVTPGKWGTQAAVDPLMPAAADLEKLFPNLTPAEKAKNLPGPVIADLKAELKTISTILANKGSPEYAALAADVSTLKTREREILQNLDAFKAFPTDAASTTRAAYQSQYVNSYWRWEERAYGRIGALPPGDQQNAAWSAFQAERDNRDQPVTVDGIKFPSPARMAWAQLDPLTRQARLAKLAAADFSYLTGYELDLMGVPRTSPRRSRRSRRRRPPMRRRTPARA